MGSCLPEYARERELFKHDPTLINNITFNDRGRPLPSSQLRTSPDPILTSLAQLGACRTRTSRSLISVFDRQWQYVVAEATPTLPLGPSLAEAERGGEELWLCQTAIPRVHGVCEWTLTCDDRLASSRLPVTIVNDLQADTRFCEKPFCLPGSPARFYAAAPIRSSRGVNMGVYCVIHTEPITDQFVKDIGLEAVVRDIARTITSHLEFRRSAASLKQYASMMGGITSFLDKQDTLYGGATQSQSTAHHDARGALHGLDFDEKDGTAAKLSHLSPQDDDKKTLHPAGLRPSVSSPSLRALDDGARGGTGPAENASDSVAASVTRPDLHLRSSTAAPDSYPSSWTEGHNVGSVGDVCMRVAGVVRASLKADCVVYVNASSGAFGSLVETPGEPDQTSDSVTASSGDEVSPTSQGPPDESCQILGVSGQASPDADAANATLVPLEIPRKLLSALLRRYPRGNIFNFDENGELQTSESSEDGVQPAPREAPKQPHRRYSEKHLTRNRIGELLAKTFRNARSIVFAPAWDDKKQRWFAGCLACTYSHNRIFTARGELSYLRAFGMLTVAEVHRSITAASYQAQADVLGSLSHELRSPLHGLLLSAELLADTRLDTFQGGMLHTIETCGRTLLDTVDHLLEYSKVNNFMMSAHKGKNKARGMRGGGNSVEDGMKSQLSDVKLDLLVEEVVESVYAGFQRLSADFSKHNGLTTGPDVGANAPSEPMLVVDGPGGTDEQHEVAKQPYGVSMSLDIEPSDTYDCWSSAGAVRRIVMNLLGNSLKFTNAGCVKVSLSREPSPSKLRGVKQRMIKIVVKDTGIGMSKDFLAHDAYKPFAQVDRLSAGTGLGLSLVRKLVSSLRGDISIRSQMGIGTVTTVTLPMPPVDHDTGAKEQVEFARQKQMLKGLRVYLAGFQPESPGLGGDGGGGGTRAKVAMSAAGRVCSEWLGMKIVPASSADGFAPDIVLCTETVWAEDKELLSATGWPPVVVVCPTALAAHSRTMDYMLRANGIFEFISQPTGPRKLAKVLLFAFDRWLESQSAAVPSTSPHMSASPFAQTDPLATPSTNRSVGWFSPSSSTSLAEQPASYFPPVATVPLKPEPPPEPKPRPPPKSPGPGPSTLSPFPVSLPIAPKPEAPAAAEFLLVDDNQINLRILCAYMKKLQRTYLTATDGVEAVEVFKAQNRPFACILMDISMPRLDGLQATQQIRAHEADTGAATACSIFALTGLASADTQREAFESGVDLFLTKPVKLKELSDILKSRGLVS